ncbi:hypothetical protein NP493_106g02037 [Ridgeia piscesae]|uniref:NADH dehydrogenase [ubiquinone] 1 beta subcomplex subunit 4 n=1 Tax=Ridgeia piscesae TaxID=27915 RepID=A0AAD9P788_RIDPI|nr:hypothetical protein NP493_106g02037 [Ridgeia piscesae]
MSTVKGRNWDPNKMFDVSPEEMRAIQERAEMRNAMRKEFQKKISNPYRGVGGYTFDPAVQRFLSMRANHWEQFKASPKNFGFVFAVVVLPMVGMWYAMDKAKTELEYKCRTGQIAYKDRLWKFV